jgi:hypothetical protein
MLHVLVPERHQLISVFMPYVNVIINLNQTFFSVVVPVHHILCLTIEIAFFYF